MVGAVLDLSSFYQSTLSGTKEDQPLQIPAFLSQIDLSHYHSMEERFTHELTAFTKKQFFEVKMYNVVIIVCKGCIQ